MDRPRLSEPPPTVAAHPARVAAIERRAGPTAAFARRGHPGRPALFPSGIRRTAQPARAHPLRAPVAQKIGRR